MELINGKNFFRLLLVLALTNCAGEGQNEAKNGIYFRVKDYNDYRKDDEGYNLEPLRDYIENGEGVWLSLLSLNALEALTFYNKDGELLKRSSYEGSIDNFYFKFRIVDGKIHGKLTLYKKTYDKYTPDDGYYFHFLKYKDLQSLTTNHVENLELAKEITFYHGIRHGKYRKFNEGHLVEMGKYIYGNKVGKCVTFFDNGQILSVEHFNRGGQQEGERIEYHKNGKLKRKELYVLGELISSQLFNTSGKLLVAKEIKDTITNVRAFDEISKTFINYTIEGEKENYNRRIIGNCYLEYNDEGVFIGKTDLTECKSGKITISLPNATVTYMKAKGNNKATCSCKVQEGINSYYIYDDTRVIRHMRGNNLIGTYDLSTGLVDGEFDFYRYGDYRLYLDADTKTIIEIGFEKNKNYYYISHEVIERLNMLNLLQLAKISR
jgi:antitoxin component YwqK of YwqJK toxin-antitoxin module